MPISLRDKLKAADSAVQQPVNQNRDGIKTVDTVYPLSEFPNLSDITSDTLTLMDKAMCTARLRLDKILFLDTESTGLSTGAGTIAFLIGVGFIEKDQFTVRQFFMRDYGDEYEMLSRFQSLFNQYDIIVSFNGKSFDLPLLRSRFAMNRLDDACLNARHLDLLFTARRIFKLRLSRCNLSRLEEIVLGVRRENDIPGAIVPELYFSYLKTGDLTLLDGVMKHNNLDVVSLCALLCHISRMYNHPESICHQKDTFSVGKTLEKRNERQRAQTCYLLAARGDMTAPCYSRLGFLYRADGNIKEAVRMFQKVTQISPEAIEPHIELAKIYEHRYKDYAKALKHTQKALEITSRNEHESDPILQETHHKIQCRSDRLSRKLNER